MNENLKNLDKMSGKEMLQYLSDEIVFGHTFKTFQRLTEIEAFNLLKHAQKQIDEYKYGSDDDVYIQDFKKLETKLFFIKEIIER